MPVFQYEVAREVTVKQSGIATVTAETQEEADAFLASGKLSPNDIEWYDVSIPLGPEKIKPYY